MENIEFRKLKNTKMDSENAELRLQKFKISTF